MLRPTMPRFCLAALLLLLTSAQVSAQDLPLPDWSTSSLECPATVRERDVLRCTLTVRRGAVDRFDEPAGTEWTVTLPDKALFAEVDAESGATFDPERRVLQGQALIAPAGVQAVRFSLVAAPETDGTRLTVRASVAGAETTYLSATTEAEARRRPGETTAIGPVAVTSAGLWVMGFLATGPIFIGGCALLGGARPGVLGLAVAAWVAAGFLLVFAALAREDARLLSDYREAACVVTDTGLHTRTSGQGRHATNISEPFVAVRFEVAGRTTFGTGFDSGSHLRVGGGTWPGRELAAFGPGAAVPCWYDPEDPARAIVVRGPGGAYLFGLLPLGLLALVARPLWQAVTRGMRRTA